MSTLSQRGSSVDTKLSSPEYTVIADELSKLMVIAKETGQEASTTRTALEAFAKIAIQQLQITPALM